MDPGSVTGRDHCGVSTQTQESTDPVYIGVVTASNPIVMAVTYSTADTYHFTSCSQP